MSSKEQTKLGRPKKYNVDLDVVAKMASYGCSPKEIADVLNVPYKSIIRDGKEALIMGKANMRCRLRKAQYDTALKGNPALLIWLGKNVLGQSDEPMPQDEELSDEIEFELDEGEQDGQD